MQSATGACMPYGITQSYLPAGRGIASPAITPKLVQIIIHFISGNMAHKNTNKQKQKRTIHTYTHNTREHREDRNTKLYSTLD